MIQYRRENGDYWKLAQQRVMMWAAGISKNRTRFEKQVFQALSFSFPVSNFPQTIPSFTSFQTSRYRFGERQMGFTLLEVLVAVTIFFVVSGLLTSGVTQAFRISERGAVESAKSRDDAIRLAWFREAVGLSVADAELKERSFKGQARTFNGFTLAQLDGKGAAAGQYQWLIEFDAASGRTGLYYQVKRPARVGSLDQKFLVTDWSGSAGEFRYLDERGTWQNEWPPTFKSLSLDSKAQLSNTTLPYAVELRYGEAFLASSNMPQSIIVAIQDRSPALPSLREILQ